MTGENGDSPAGIHVNTMRQSRIFFHAVAWTVMAVGALLLLAQYFDVDSNHCDSLREGEHYLLGVFRRSLCGSYQMFMLGAWLAMLPHFFVLVVFFRSEQLPGDYDEFGKWSQTAFTSLGFLGTIVGISLAVAGLRTAMAADDPHALITGLSTAFDTTFLGLGASVTILLCRKWIEIAVQ